MNEIKSHSGGKPLHSQKVLQRPWSLYVIAIAAALVVGLRPFKQRDAIYSDGAGYHLWTRAILEGDFSFQNYVHNEEACGLVPIAPGSERYRNVYPPGVALVRLPVMIFLVDLKQKHPLVSTAEHWASRILGALALLATCGFCLMACQRLAIPAFAANLAVFALTFGTGLFHYGTVDSGMSHVYSALVAMYLFVLGLTCVLDQRERLPIFPLILLSFLLVLIRNMNVLLLAGLLIVYCLSRKELGAWGWHGFFTNLAALTLGVTAAAAIQLGYNAWASGRFLFSSYGDGGFCWDRPMQLAVLFSYERGLFLYYPVVGITLTIGFLARGMRPWVLCYALVLLAYVTLYGYWNCWTLGGSFGYRGFVELMPFASILFAAGLARLAGGIRIVTVVATLLCVLLTLQLMVGAWTFRLMRNPDPAASYWGHVCGRWSVLRFLYAQASVTSRSPSPLAAQHCAPAPSPDKPDPS